MSCVTNTMVLPNSALQAKEFVLQLLANDWVDGAEGFVHQHDGRVGRKCARDADALLLTT